MNRDEYLARMPKTLGKASANDRKLMELMGRGKDEKTPKRSKYGNVKVEIDGYTFDSKAEANYYQDLRMLHERHKIRFLIVHPGWDLGSCYYKADFSFEQIQHDPSAGNAFDYWKFNVVDVKGVLTRDFKIKLKLMREKYGIDVKLLTSDSDPRLFK